MSVGRLDGSSRLGGFAQPARPTSRYTTPKARAAICAGVRVAVRVVVRALMAAMGWLISLRPLAGGQLACGPGGEGLDGEAGVDCPDSREDRSVTYPQVVDIVRSAVRVHDRGRGVRAHAAGAQQVVVAVVEEGPVGASSVHDPFPVDAHGVDESAVVVAVGERDLGHRDTVVVSFPGEGDPVVGVREDLAEAVEEASGGAPPADRMRSSSFGYF